jgi:hypothetical protein
VSETAAVAATVTQQGEGAAHGELVRRADAGEAGRAVTAVSNPPAPGVVPAARRRPGRLLGVTGTPRTLRLVLVGLVLLSLAWGAVAAWMVSQRASGANDVVGVSEPLSLDGQQIYRALSDADATEATAFLAGGLEPTAARRHYLADLAQASVHLEALPGGPRPGLCPSGERHGGGGPLAGRAESGGAVGGPSCLRR